VFLADRTIPRPKGWQRKIEICVPATNSQAWTAASPLIEAMLGFLTSDSWNVSIEQAPKFEANPATPAPTESPDGVVCLFSGGSDSVAGALTALAQEKSVILVSHWDWSVHAGVQNALVTELKKAFPGQVEHLSLQIGRQQKQIDGKYFADEPSRRSRSLLFIALGLAVASVRHWPLWIAENGFTSLNVPLAGERLGALSTRTTHPRFLQDVSALLAEVGAYGDFVLPFSDATKGEMFTSVAKAVGIQLATSLLNKTHSCSHARWAGTFHQSPQMHCGICLGCAVRRAGFAASGLKDETMYLSKVLHGAQLTEFLTTFAASDVATMAYVSTREFTMADILGLSLPATSDLERSLDLVERGFAELALVAYP
jgi:7-cyano-7-deazaguanine synthase in queuosine biosynthesis